MRLIFPIALFAILASGCQFTHTPQSNAAVSAKSVDSLSAKTRERINPPRTDTVAIGDIDHDRRPDTAFVYTPPTMSTYDENGELDYTFGCVDDACFNRIRFSCGIPDLVIDDSVWGKVESAGDIDHDGISEILFERNWFVGSSAGLELYQFKHGKWHLAAKTVYRPQDSGSLKPQLVSKRGQYFLKGIKAFEGDKLPDLVEIKLKR